MINWVGNKIKYINEIKKIVNGFDNVIDPMMGSGNVLLELIKSHNIIGNDLVKLTPEIFKKYLSFNISERTFLKIIKKWKFSDKKHYYTFRDYWNKKYLSNKFNKDFLLETYLLLKMCSNSMVRFNNKKGYFNQGFRGISSNKKKSFFENTNFKRDIKYLNTMKENIVLNKSLFFNLDVIDFLELIKKPLKKMKKTIFLFDPPYLVYNEMYKTDGYNADIENKIYNFIIKNKISFLFFNTVKSGINHNLQCKKFIKDNNYKVIKLSDKTHSGQGRKGTKKIKEIIFTNIK